MTPDLYAPTDVLEAHDTWGASCGAASLAALLGRPVMDVRNLFRRYPGWVTPTAMGEAVLLAGRTWSSIYTTCLPKHGLAWVQFEGPWEKPGVPPGAAYRHTHWIAADQSHGVMVYDCNAGWIAPEEWRDSVLPELMAMHRRCTGWRIRKAWEVSDAD